MLYVWSALRIHRLETIFINKTNKQTHNVTKSTIYVCGMPSTKLKSPEWKDLSAYLPCVVWALIVWIYISLNYIFYINGLNGFAFIDFTFFYFSITNLGMPIPPSIRDLSIEGPWNKVPKNTRAEYCSHFFFSYIHTNMHTGCYKKTDDITSQNVHKYLSLLASKCLFSS